MLAFATVRTAFFCASALVAGGASAAEPIKVIAAFNLTGDAAVLDSVSYNGAVLAAEMINKAGGVLGRPIELVPVDTESKIELGRRKGARRPRRQSRCGRRHRLHLFDRGARSRSRLPGGGPALHFAGRDRSRHTGGGRRRHVLRRLWRRRPGRRDGAFRPRGVEIRSCRPLDRGRPHLPAHGRARLPRILQATRRHDRA